MFHAKNYLNRPVFHEIIKKITLAQFFETRRILWTVQCRCSGRLFQAADPAKRTPRSPNSAAQRTLTI